MTNKQEMMDKRVLFFILNIVFIFNLQAQENIPDMQDNLAIKGTVANDSVLLRWAPANVPAWIDGKKYGYVMERFTVYKNGVFQDVPERKLIEQSFLPKPLEEWEALILASDYAAVIAQAFYGDDFDVTASANDVATIINQSKELEQRFAMSLFMAEYDFQGALFAGWAYADRDVKPDEQYLYRIHINRPVPQPGDTAVALIGLPDVKALPKPVDLYAVFGDQAVLLSWTYYLHANTYHSYHVERASDADTTFRQITDIPVSVQDAGNQMILYTDSLPDNTHVYRYRVRGITSFGRSGPCSDEISGQGAKKVSCIPNILNATFVRPDTVEIFWEYDCEDLSAIEKTVINCSEEEDGEYEPASASVLPTQQSVQIPLPYSSAYLKVNLYMKDGSRTESFPFRVQQVDSIPPAVPVDLTAYIDTLGVAHLSWKANQEPDLRGYRVLRSFLEQEEKSSITPQLIDISEFTDTLALDNLNTVVYYAVSALDMNYNESKPSLTVKAEKPNLSAPNEPVITSFTQDENKITLTWITSRRDTTITYELIRTSQEGAEKVVFKGDYRMASYTDQAPNGTYTYTVAAVSRSGKHSVSPRQPVFTVAVLEKLNPVSDFRSYISDKNDYVELRWRKQPQAETYFLYKKTGNEPMVLIREFSADKDLFVDEVITPTTDYTYVILYSISTGQKSQPASLTIHF